MTDENYKAVLNEAISRLGNLTQKRDQLELDIQKTIQFIHATANMLPDAERDKFWFDVQQVASRAEIRTEGLTAAIKDILSKAPKEWFTITMVRDRLVASGFDFSGYTSNPLASISTVLKRANPDQIENKRVESVNAYRWNAKKAPDRKKFSLYQALLRTQPRPFDLLGGKSPAQVALEQLEAEPTVQEREVEAEAEDRMRMGTAIKKPESDVDLDAAMRTMNRFGSGIAGEIPDAADRDLTGDQPTRVTHKKH
jgi:hypothetical protein